MKRSAIKRKTPMWRTKAGGPSYEREPKPAAKPTLKPLHRGTYEGGTTSAAPKERPMRDQALRDMAQGRPCMLMVPAICNARTDTTVLCHQNEGKGMSLKQSDAMAVWGCSACHEWYDRSSAPREQKRAAFNEAHPRQMQAYRQVEADLTEPERFRRAAWRALQHLGAMPMRGEA